MILFSGRDDDKNEIPKKKNHQFKFESQNIIVKVVVMSIVVVSIDRRMLHLSPPFVSELLPFIMRIDPVKIIYFSRYSTFHSISP